jgi:ubiquinone/menaquinone biosynthesis C-methylase UbiE
MAGHVCPPWLSFTLTNVFRGMFHDPEKILARFIKPGDTVLDVGCGPGFFTIPMAGMVGEKGLVIAADISAGMLRRVKRRAKRARVSGRILLQLSEKDRLGISQKVDFALAFWTAHEVGDLERFFADMKVALQPDGVFLLVEPKMHVSDMSYDEIVAAAERAGLRPFEEVPVRLSHATAFRGS